MGEGVIESEERERLEKESQRIRSKLLRVTDEKRIGCEENHREEGDGAAASSPQEERVARNGSDAPQGGNDLASCVGGVEALDQLLDNVVERRMKRVPAQRRPEEAPGAVNDVRLEDFVEPIGEMVEPKEPERRGD